MYLVGYMVVLLIASCSASTKYSRIAKTFTEYMIVPMVIPKVPSRELSARFYSDKISLGNRIPAYATVSPPVVYYEANSKVLHTIVILDADSPSVAAPIYSQGLHACLVNIPGNNLAECNYVTPYMPTIPYPGSGPHRYVILLYRQSRPIDINGPYIQQLDKNYFNFSVTNFSAQYGLGDPIGGNFYLTEMTICKNDEEINGKCSI